MISAEQIAALRESAVDFSDAEALKSRFAALRSERKPFFLTASEFDDILEWKLRQQYGRQRHLRTANTEDIIRQVTGLALNITHEDPDYELELRIGILCSLRGVGVPIASAVLALVFPDQYAVIDFRVWRQLFGQERDVFSIPGYKRYMREIRRLAAELGWSPQEVDMAIWEYDRRIKA